MNNAQFLVTMRKYCFEAAIMVRQNATEFSAVANGVDISPAEELMYESVSLELWVDRCHIHQLYPITNAINKPGNYQISRQRTWYMMYVR